MNKETIIEVEQQAKQYSKRSSDHIAGYNPITFDAYKAGAIKWAEKYLAEKDRADRLEEQLETYSEHLQRLYER